MADIRQRIVIDAVDNTAKGVKSAQRNASALETTLTRLRATLLGFVGISIGLDVIRGLGRISDEAVELTAKLRLLTDSTQDYNQAFSTLFDLSVKTGTAFEANVTLFNRLKLAFASTGSEAQNFALQVTEVLNNSLRISGASAQESASTIRQFSQAMASGVLRGEEFNAIMENSPRLVQALTDSLGVGVGELRALSKEGKLSAEVVRDAILEQQDAIRKQAESLPITIGRSIENLNTALTVWFTNFEDGNSQIAGYVNSLAQNFDVLADATLAAGKAGLLYFGVSAIKGISERAAAFTEAKNLELTAFSREIAAQKQSTTELLASARIRAAENAKAISEKIKQEQITVRLAAVQKAQLAEEEVAAAQSAVIQAKKSALLKQFEDQQKKAALDTKIRLQEALIAEKEAAVERAVQIETIRQKKKIAAQEEQLQIEAAQLARAEGLVEEKRIAVETAAIREQQRQEAEFDRAQRAQDAEIRQIQAKEALIQTKTQLIEEKKTSAERAELQEIERQKREAIAVRKRELVNEAIGDNKRETLSLDQLIQKLNVKFEVDQKAVAAASERQRASIANAEATIAETKATIDKIKAGETEQVQIREGFVLNQERITQAKASAAADLESAVAKRDLIAQAQAQGITVAELTARQKEQSIVQVENTKLDQEKIAAVRATAEAEVAAAKVKLEAIRLAQEQGISVAQATKQITAQTAATLENTNVDRAAVLAATEKERARLRAAKAAQTEAAAELESATVTGKANKATFEATELTGAQGKASQLLAEKIRIEIAAKNEDTTVTKANTLATEANTVAKGANATARGAATAATAAGTAATTANTTATAANAAASGGLVANLKAFLTQPVGKFFGNLTTSSNKAVAGLFGGFSKVFGIIGRIGGALLGWPGLIAYVLYEVGKYFVDFELLWESAKYAVERVGVAIANIFRNSEDSEKAIQDLKDKYAASVDEIIEKRRLQKAGFETAAQEEAAIAQELKEKIIRLENEKEKKISERIGKLGEYYDTLQDYEDDRREDRSQTLDEEIAALDTELEERKAKLAERLQGQEDFQTKSEELQNEYETKKLDLTISSAEEELQVAKKLTEEIEFQLDSENEVIREAYSERLQIQRQANAAIVSGLQAALKKAADLEIGYLDQAKTAAERRKAIEKDFTEFKRGALGEERSIIQQYYDIAKDRREANAKLREADKLKEKGELEEANKLYSEAYDELKEVAGAYEDLSKNTEASTSEQRLAKSALVSTISETGTAAQKIGDIQSSIEKNALSNAQQQAERQATLKEQLAEYRGELEKLDEVISREREIQVDLNTRAVLNSIDRIDSSIKALSQTITVTVRKVEENQIGGMILKRQSGGDVPAPNKFVRRQNKVPGSGSGDIVPAMLEPGEFVIRKSSVRKYGEDLLYKLNSGQLPGFNKGGLAGDTIPRFKRGGFLRKMSKEELENRFVKKYENLIEQVQGVIGGYESAKQKNLSEFTPGRVSNRRNTFALLRQKGQADIARYILDKVGNLDSKKLDSASYFRLQSIVSTLLAGTPASGPKGGVLIARKNIVNRLGQVQGAKAALEALIKELGSSGTLGFNEGGDVPGFGTGDTVKALLTPGEYVVNRKSVEKFGAGFFDSINQGTMPKKYATGGVVKNGSSVSSTNTKTINVNLSLNGASAMGSFEDNAATRTLLSQLESASLTAG